MLGVRWSGTSPSRLAMSCSASELVTVRSRTSVAAMIRGGSASTEYHVEPVGAASDGSSNPPRDPRPRSRTRP